jgi:hypothetical protein
MAGGQYQVDPSALIAGGSEFERQYTTLVGAISAFQGRALDISGAFGFLGPSGSVLQQYEATTEKAFRALDQLAKLLIGASGALVTTAANYRKADAASTMNGG